MSHSFPPPPKRTPWWRFKSLRDLRTDRGHFRAALTRYDQARAGYGFPPVKHQGWIARHKIFSSIVGFFVFLSLIAQCGGEPATVADPAPLAQATLAAPAPSEPTTAPPTKSPTPTLDPAAQKAAEAQRMAEEKKQAAAVTKKRAAAKAAARKKAAAVAKKKAAAKKLAAKRKAAAKRAAAKEAAQERFEADHTFGNCPELHRTYPHAVGRAGARDHVRGRTRPVTTFKRSTRIYELNSGSDRDDDGIACEKL